MDLVFLGGNVMTMDRGGTRAEALAVKDGKIAAVGASGEIGAMVSEGTEVVPLAGRTLIPGFVDPHNHFSATVFDPVAVDCWTPPHESIAGIKDAIARAASAALPGQWIFGWGFAGDYVREGRNLTRRDLDDAATDNPVCIMDGSHHSCYANSLAMQLGGIDSSTPDPRGGQILKDDQGEPSGELWERAMDPVHSLCLKAHVDHYGDGAADFVYRNSMKHLSVGITSVGEALVTPDAARLYKMADEQGKIPIALRQQLGGLTFFRAPEEASRGELGIEDTSDRLRGGTLKMFMDPVFPDAANFKCHDNGESERVGSIYYSQEEADELVLSAHKLGMQVIIHCLGPWAIEQALNSFERALREKPVSDPRFRIEHFTMPTREQIEKSQITGRDSLGAAAFHLHLGRPAASASSGAGPHIRDRGVSEHDRCRFDGGGGVGQPVCATGPAHRDPGRGKPGGAKDGGARVSRGGSNPNGSATDVHDKLGGGAEERVGGRFDRGREAGGPRGPRS